MKIAIVAITRNGARLGLQLMKGFPGSKLFVIDRHAPGEARAFSGGLRPLVDRLWGENDALVFIMATGIVVRTIAPLLQAKDRDPGVVTIDDAGRFAISLVSGHLGGANELAAQCAQITGALPVITTATDANGLPSFDMLAKDEGWHIEDLSRVKRLNALLLEGRTIAVVDPTGTVRHRFGSRGELAYHASFEEALSSGAPGIVFVTNRTLTPEQDSERLLVLRPKNLYLGIGCNRGTAPEEIGSVVEGTLAALSLSVNSVNCIATAKAKADEEGLRRYADTLNLPLLSFPSDDLNRIDAPSEASRHALAAIGAKGVAEPAALLASGGGILLLNKIKSGNVTLAIATKSIHSPR